MSNNDHAELGVIAGQVETVVRELVAAGKIAVSQLRVIGVSTSEVLGHHIGTGGTMDTAAQSGAGVDAVRREAGFTPLLQCCENSNRAVVSDRSAAEELGVDTGGGIP